MDSKNDGQQPVVNNIYGFQFNGCQITNPTFQTVMPSSTGAEKTEADGEQEAAFRESAAFHRDTDPERNVSREHDVDRENGVSRKQDVAPEQEAALLADDLLPEPLRTAEAQALLERMCSAGILDGRWQPVGLSITQKGVLASELADRLGIKHLWKTFGGLWHMNSETLRTGCGKSMDQRRISEFRERIRKVM